MDFTVIQGNIAHQTAHGLVNTTRSNSPMECGVAGELQTKTNRSIVDEVTQEQPLDAGDVVVTRAYDLPVLYLFHAVSASQDESATEYSIRAAIQSVLEQADKRECRSLVIPLIGCGGGEYDLETGALCICEEIWQFNPESLADVRIIGHSERDFKQVLEVGRNVKSLSYRH